MARKYNFLLGNGEKLTGAVPYIAGGGEKHPPYDLAEATVRFKTGAHEVSAQVRELPLEACPGGETVLSVAMHPRYVSKSDFPSRLFAVLGLHPVGSRVTKVKPDKWGIRKHPTTEVPTEEIFVAGSRSRILQLEKAVEGIEVDSGTAEHLQHIERIYFPKASEKVKNPPPKDKGWLEVVLHNSSKVDVLAAFSEYAKRHGADVDLERSREVGGLTFVPVSATRAVSERIARFSFLRVARSMPSLRPFRPMILRGAAAQKASLPAGGVLADGFRAVIFDGGLPQSARAPLSGWVRLVEPAGIGAAVSELEEHGLAVTSVFLFGPIIDASDMRRPICKTDHVRILDSAMLSSADPYYFDALHRILDYLDKHGHEYHFVNLSVGPDTPVDDDDVTLWTSALDERFASGEWLVSVAAGNDGEADATAGLHRIQPPGDGVNVMTVGAADTLGSAWRRAKYSCQGPGRCPGIVKPDGIIFGGTSEEPFLVLSPSLDVVGMQGTSFSSPFALRSAAAIKCQLGNALSALATRALLIQTATNSNGHSLAEVGWGKFEHDPELLITCEDHEAVVVYQGELPVGQQLRAPIPLPPHLEGKVEITATLVIATEIDPGHPSAYTRRGLTVAFRPHCDRHTTYPDGSRSTYPKTHSFFSASNMYGAPEYELRDDGHKWEPCHRGSVTMYAGSLKSPVFDIYNHNRFEGVPTIPPEAVKYALVVRVRAKKMGNLYGAIVRAYSQVLIPLRPKLRIRV